MAMFGSAISRQSLGILPGDMPPIGPPPGPFESVKRTPGFFGKGSLGKRLLGGLLDGILTQTGGQAVNLPSMLEERQRAQMLEDEQRKRQQDLQDAIALAEAKAKFREPTTLQQDYEWLTRTNPALAKQFLLNKANPVQGVRVTNPDGSEGIQFIRPGGTGPQVGAVEDGYRFKGGDPADPNSWEPAGGPSQSATGGFPGY